ncbi:MAG: phosphate acyltransferase PlsX [Oscillospiraceae bacterium]|nr:phosphate acyltransferase PlsX [Oscillospiraceae bacterium]
MRIIVDAFGGDHAPLEVLKGCALAKEEYGVEITLCGDEEKIRACAKDNGIALDGMDILHAPAVIPVEADPTTLLKEYADSSMAMGMKALKNGEGDAFVSAGSTGALVVGASLIVKRLKGVRRVGLATVIPNANKFYLLMDAGANAECRPEMLAQFGVMGSVYMERLKGVKNPRVGLINIGTEETKGLELQLESYKLLQKAPVNFIGNVEARGLALGECDVAVCDGFVGNVALKLTEGLAKYFSNELKGMFMANLKTKIAALLMKDKIAAFKKSMDYKEHGGAPLLGASLPVIKAHGSSDAKAFKNAIRQAKEYVDNKVIEEMQNALHELKTETKEAE